LILLILIYNFFLFNLAFCQIGILFRLIVTISIISIAFDSRFINLLHGVSYLLGAIFLKNIIIYSLKQVVVCLEVLQILYIMNLIMWLHVLMFLLHECQTLQDANSLWILKGFHQHTPKVIMTIKAWRCRLHKVIRCQWWLLL